MGTRVCGVVDFVVGFVIALVAGAAVVVGVVGVVVGVVVVAQTSKPSVHVRPKVGSCPHLPYQEPPGLQHVGPRGPGTHLGHSGTTKRFML